MPRASKIDKVEQRIDKLEGSINQILSILQHNITQPPPPSPLPQETEKTNATTTTDKVNKRPNKFVDDFSLETNDLPANNPEIAKLYSTRKGRSESRPAPTKVSVTCSVCHKQEMVSSILAPIRVGDEFTQYKCNRCCRR